jgi:hypothetical protein
MGPKLANAGTICIMVIEQKHLGIIDCYSWGSFAEIAVGIALARRGKFCTAGPTRNALCAIRFERRLRADRIESNHV